MNSWHKYFAWYPLYIDRKWIWLRTVWRLRYLGHYDDLHSVYSLVKPESGE